MTKFRVIFEPPSYKVPRGASVKAAMYQDYLQNTLRPKIRKNRPGLLQRGVIILHANCRVHVAPTIVEVLEKCDWEVFLQPPYSPDMSPCDYDLNPKLKEPMHGVCFQTKEELMARLTREIWRLNRNQVLDGIQKLLERWTMCIVLEPLPPAPLHSIRGFSLFLKNQKIGLSAPLI